MEYEGDRDLGVGGDGWRESRSSSALSTQSGGGVVGKAFMSIDSGDSDFTRYVAKSTTLAGVSG